LSPTIIYIIVVKLLPSWSRISNMDGKLASFTDPPVVEVVLGVQFEPLGMTSGHMGWYWKEYLGDDWPEVEETNSLPDQIEKFGERRIHWPKIGFQFTAGPTTNRLRIIHKNRDRMIQIQDTRFIYNWVKKNGTYPRYTTIRQEFVQHFAQFREFADKHGLAKLTPNQWEVTYVNHIPSGILWNVPADGAKVFPLLQKQPGSYGNTKFETMIGEWRSEIPPQRGRLHINLRYQEVKGSETSAVDVLVAHLTTRGPITEDQDFNIGLNLGHETIVKTFVDISSDFARKHWKED